MATPSPQQKPLSLKEAQDILARQKKEDAEVERAHEVLRADLQRRSRERLEEARNRKSTRLATDAELVAGVLEAALKTLRPAKDALERFGGNPSILWFLEDRLGVAKRRLERLKGEPPSPAPVQGWRG